MASTCLATRRLDHGVDQVIHCQRLNLSLDCQAIDYDLLHQASIELLDLIHFDFFKHGFKVCSDSVLELLGLQIRDLLEEFDPF